MIVVLQIPNIVIHLEVPIVARAWVPIDDYLYRPGMKDPMIVGIIVIPLQRHKWKLDPSLRYRLHICYLSYKNLVRSVQKLGLEGSKALTIHTSKCMCVGMRILSCFTCEMSAFHTPQVNGIWSGPCTWEYIYFRLHVIIMHTYITFLGNAKLFFFVSNDLIILFFRINN